MNNKLITNEDKAKALQNALCYLCINESFYGSLFQELTIKYTENVPTAGITFNKNKSQYEVYLNPTFFCNLSSNERVAVLQHEILHFTRKHLFRLPFLSANEEDRKLYNMAGDMEINQYIKNLPEGCINVKDWKYEESGIKKNFPLLHSMEEYHKLLKDNKKINEEQFNKYSDFDVHSWDQLDEETKKQMLEEAKKLLKRTIEKISSGYSLVPDSIKDLLQEIDTLSDSLNYKQILKQIIKRTISSTDRESTWKRPNKRYGIVAPGTKIGMLPKLEIYTDSSGSISQIELNEFFNVISGFLKIGSRQCYLSLWHTSIYSRKKFKLGDNLKDKDLESGGTNINCVLSDIKKRNPNLSIILTDGYYDNSDINIKSEILWIISKNGNTNHPLKNIGKTILLDNIK